MSKISLKLSDCFNYEMLNANSKTECMRDFCGSFDSIKNTSRNHRLLYLIPEATRLAVLSRKDFFDVKTEEEAMNFYRELVAQGLDSIMEDTICRPVVEGVLTGIIDVESISDEEIAKIVDIYYIHSVPASVELQAVSML